MRHVPQPAEEANAFSLDASKDRGLCVIQGPIGLIMPSYSGFKGILTGLTRSTDHPRGAYPNPPT